MCYYYYRVSHKYDLILKIHLILKFISFFLLDTKKYKPINKKYNPPIQVLNIEPVGLNGKINPTKREKIMTLWISVFLYLYLLKKSKNIKRVTRTKKMNPKIPVSIKISK